MDYWCITASECKSLNSNQTSEMPFTPFQGVCQQGCPSDYELKYADWNKLHASCTPCYEKRCRKTCSARYIFSIEDARKLRHCRYINGSMTIMIRSPDSSRLIENELEDSLSEIAEIDGCLEILTTPINTLGFFQGLRAIHGEKGVSGSYSLDLHDNPLLRDLFDEDQQIQIKGSLIFTSNPRLCFDEIEKLAAKSGGLIRDYQMTKFSNSFDRNLCHYTHFKVEVAAVNSTFARLEWRPVRFHSVRYVIDYFFAYDERRTFLNNRFEANELRRNCDSLLIIYVFSRKSLLVDDDSTNMGSFSVVITNLHPTTKYSYFVKAFSLDTYKAVAYSDVGSFTTLPTPHDDNNWYEKIFNWFS